jgi:hypothetical protein
MRAAMPPTLRARPVIRAAIAPRRGPPIPAKRALRPAAMHGPGTDQTFKLVSLRRIRSL